MTSDLHKLFTSNLITIIPIETRYFYPNDIHDYFCETPKNYYYKLRILYKHFYKQDYFKSIENSQSNLRAFYTLMHVTFEWPELLYHIGITPDYSYICNCDDC